MEFSKNFADQLDSKSVGAVRVWRHQIICKLIDAGITNPKEIEYSVASLYRFVVSQVKKDQEMDKNTGSEKEFIKTTTLSLQLNGVHLLNRLINQANLNEDQLDEINFFLNPYSVLEVKKL